MNLKFLLLLTLLPLFADGEEKVIILNSANPVVANNINQELAAGWTVKHVAASTSVSIAKHGNLEERKQTVIVFVLERPTVVISTEVKVEKK